MRLLKSIATLAALSLPLMAATCDEKIQAFAVKTCNALGIIYAHYDKVKEDGVIPIKYTNPVDAIRLQSDKLCVSPSTINTLVLAGVAGEAYLALRAAFKAGEGQGDADYEASEGLDKLEDLRMMLEKVKRE